MSERYEEVVEATKSDDAEHQVSVKYDKRTAIRHTVNYAGLALVFVTLCILLAKTDTAWYMFFSVIGAVWSIRNLAVNLLRYTQLAKRK